MKKYRKLPVVIEAMQFTYETKDIIFHWITCNCYADFEDGKPILVIQTLEGDMTVRFYDWVIKGVNGEFYPCKPDIFAKTYEEEL
jgi:hypothetical protein